MLLRILYKYFVHLHANAYKMKLLSEFVKTRRKQLGLTQEEFAGKAGVALTVIRKIEQGKENLSLSKVNHVLQMFGHVLVPVNEKECGRE
ncbi:MAG: helix-turn-helix domain-containing protein [Bacteroidales bacterium]